MVHSLSLLLLSIVPSITFAQVPTWPNPATDELEDTMFLNTGHRAKQFPQAVTPCSASTVPGRQASAEWLRTGFHDVATANVNFGTNGLDASIIYELGNNGSGSDTDAGFATSLKTWEPFYGPRISFADLIALGTYASVRTCGGPVIPIRPGRQDATVGSTIAIPLPQNSIYTLTNQFLRLGFNTTDMIILVACGHTIGGVHATNNPIIVPPGSYPPYDYKPMDSSISTFDNRIAVEYVAGNTTDPMVNGPNAVAHGYNADKKVFNADQGVTMQALTNPAYFQSQCQRVLQNMIEVVPSGVTLGNPLTPYEVKPYGLQLYLTSDQTLTFSGEIRVRTTNRAVQSVQLTYTDRNGGNNCNGCTITTQDAGSAAGFDDTFEFYSFSASIPASSSISSFTVQILDTSGTTEQFNNNGAGYPVQDSLLFQYPQSCTSSSSMTITAAVRNSSISTAPNLNVVGRNYYGATIKPFLNYTSTPMNAASTVGSYQLYNLTVQLNPTQASTSRFNLTAGSFTAAIDLPAFSSLSTSCSSNPAVTVSNTTIPSNSTSSTNTTSSTNSTSPSYNATYLGCYTDSVQSRTLQADGLANHNMTTATCASYCSAYKYFGTEYSSECYCANTLSNNPANNPSSQCNMACSGDSTSMCGGSDRLSLYQNSAYVAPTLGGDFDGYNYVGCYTDDVSNRTLATARQDNNTLTTKWCADYCSSQGFTYMGTEYSSECYCANALTGTAAPAPGGESDCSMACSGDSDTMCGGPNRLSLYKTSSTPPTATPSATATPLANGTFDGYTYVACYTDNVQNRTLAASRENDNNLTTQACADWCSAGGYTYMGTEYSSECYCANALTGGATLAPGGESDCSMTCSGDPTRLCGGPDRMNLYSLTGKVTRRSEREQHVRRHVRRSGSVVGRGVMGHDQST